MNTLASSSAIIRGVFTQPGRDLVGMVEDLLAACRAHQLELDWHTGRCRV